MNTSYIQILADLYNKQRASAICTAVFSPWTIFTPADDEFIEECMNMFHRWTVLPKPLIFSDFAIWVIESDGTRSRVFPREEEECDGVCCRYMESETDSEGVDCSEDKDIEQDLSTSSVSTVSAIDVEEEKEANESDSDYCTQSDGSYHEDYVGEEDSEEERTSAVHRRTDLAGYTPIATDSSISISEYGRPQYDDDGVREAIERMFISESSTTSSVSAISLRHEETEEAEVCSGPFADLLACLLPPVGTPVLINGLLVPSQSVMTPSSPVLSSLFLRDRSLSHHSILSSSSSIDSHLCGSDCEWYDTLPSDEECEPLLEASTSCSSSASSTSTCPLPETTKLVIRLLAECDEMMDKIVDMKKNLKTME